MKFRFEAVLLMIAITLASTSYTYAEYKCDPAGNQQEMNACAEDDFKKADLELNKVYKAILQKEKSDTLFIKKFRESQKAWIKFRDAELEAAYACEGSALVCWGSMYPGCYHVLKTKLTKERIERLKKYLSEGRPADDCG